MLPSLLSPNKLKKILTTTSGFYDKFRIIEANLGDNTENYKNAHIDKAIFLNTLECAENTELNPRNVPKPDCFKDYVGSMGIGNKQHLILYDRSQYGFYASSRMWWVFRLFGHENVSILNGGLRLWAMHNYELSTEMPNFTKEKFTINLNKDLIRDYEAVQKNIASPHEQLVDCRSSDEFNSINEHGVANHIPGAKNVSYTDLFDKENGTIKDKQDLLNLFEENNVDLSKPMVASCLTGMTACSLALAAHLAGKSTVPVYYGSWTEFSKKQSN